MENNGFGPEWLYSIISGGISAFLAWFFTKRKQTADAESTELDNVDKAIKIWREVAGEFEKKFTALQDEVMKLRTEVMTLQSENRSLQEKNLRLQEEIATVKQLIK